MSKRFRIAKRISMEDIDHFEDIEVDDDFVDKDMVQIIADNEYDPMYDDCESIAVALKLAGYGKVADLEAKLAESEKDDFEYLYDKSLEKIANLKEKLAENEKKMAEKLINQEKEYLEQLKKQTTLYYRHLKEKDQEIDQLKQQLAEKDLRIEELESQFAYECECNKQFVDCQKENENLKQQLAEKDRKIKGLGLYKKNVIEFAVEQLEKAKEFLYRHDLIKDYQSCAGKYFFEQYIDNQIKQLKEGK